MKRGIISEIEQVLSAICLILIVLSILANIVARFVFNSPFTWSVELVTILVIWSVYFSFGINYRDNTHLSITVVAERLRARVKAVLDILTDALLVVTLSVMLVNCGIAMKMNYGMTTMALDISVSLAYYLAVGVGSVSMLGYLIRKYYRKLRKDAAS
jgi:TRAP-type C4-dicarboxylate transport system permease small subunit